VAEATTTTRQRRIRGLDAGERREQRRRQLLDAALDLFAEQGYASTSIEQVCQTAYVGTKSFYELFDSKEACYLALLERTSQEISDRVVAALDEAPDDERRATRLLLGAFAHALVDDPRIARTTFGGAAGISPAIERQRRVNRRWSAGFLEEVWARYGVATPSTGAEHRRLHRLAVGTIGGLFDLVVDWLHDAEAAVDAGGSTATPNADTPDVDALIDDLTAFYGVVRDGLAGLGH
jgi:AcrR family transcriptional regulator